MNYTLLDKKFSAELALICRHVVKANEIARSIRGKGFREDEVEVKSGWDLVTKGDLAAQEHILFQLQNMFGGSRCRAEEYTPGFNDFVLADAELHLQSSFPNVFGIDPIDGTEEFYLEGTEWSTAVYWMKHGEFYAGVTYAPDVLGGFLCVAEKGRGTLCLENKGLRGRAGRIRELSVAQRTLKHPPLPFVRHGVSLTRDDKFSKFFYTLNKRVAPKSITSCALAMAYVAAGKIHGFVHTPLPSYDWGPGVTPILEAGGTIQFYQIVQDRVELLDKPDLVNPTGFVAGHPDIVPWVVAMLVKYYGQTSVSAASR